MLMAIYRNMKLRCS